MLSHQLINLLVSITLVEMMLAIGMGVAWDELIRVVKNGRLMLVASFANYVIVPAVTVALMLLTDAPPFAEAGFLILAVCPGAAYGPPIATLGKGNLAVAVGLMVVLAGSSAVLAPVMLHLLLPLLSGEDTVRIELWKLIGVLVVTQFLPLCVGLAVRQFWPTFAQNLLKPAKVAGIVLNVILVGLLIATHLSLFTKLTPGLLFTMSALLIVSLAAGWWLGGPSPEDRRTLSLTTSLRNVGLSLVISTSAFPDTPAVAAVMGYGFFEILGSLLLATWWHRKAKG